MKNFDKQALERIIEMGNKLLLQNDQVFDINKAVHLKSLYQSLFLYFKKDKEFLNLNPSYSFKKGLFINGAVGSGKSLAMMTFSELLRGTSHYFPIVDCVDVVEDYLKYPETIDKYTTNSFKVGYKNDVRLINRPLIYCFDDLGYEDSGKKRYGNIEPVMERIIYNRYKYFKKYGMKTYFITNQNKKELIEAYGQRIVDRLREMCNQITIESSESLRS